MAVICMLRTRLASIAAGSSSALALDAAFLAYIACCAGKLPPPHSHPHPPTHFPPPLPGHTSASEIGILSPSPPRLLTTGRRVPPGTNGAVTWLGSAASAAGGAIVGIAYGVCDIMWLEVGQGAALRAACCGALAGMVGSLVDSALGATLQYSALDASGKRVVSSRAEAPQESQRISGRDVLSNAQVRAALLLLSTRRHVCDACGAGHLYCGERDVCSVCTGCSGDVVMRRWDCGGHM
jgi:hypothetical protein